MAGSSPTRGCIAVCSVKTEAQIGDFRDTVSEIRYRRLRIATIVSSSAKWPAWVHASSPPSRGRTLVKPFSIRARATRAAEASFGQAQ